MGALQPRLPRHRTRYGGSEDRARAAAVLLLTLRGTPFLYAGEEIGLEDAAVPPERRVDPGGRDACRAPLPWEPEPPHGWASDDPWLPWPPEPHRRNVTTQRSDPGSLLHLYRRLLAARRASPALHRGVQRMLPGPDGVLAFERCHDDDRRIVVVNFTADAQRAPVEGAAVVEVDSRSLDEGRRYDGGVPPDTALVLRPHGADG